MTTTEELAERASALLVSVAQGTAEAAAAYDTLLYPLVLAAVRKRGRLLPGVAQQLTGTDGMGVPEVPACDAEWVANDVTVLALERARAAADRFDPQRGDGASWAIRQAAFAYVDVVRNAYGVRREIAVVPTEDEELAAAVDGRAAVPSPADRVEMRAALDEMLASLPDLQRKVLLLVMHYGLSYAETAELLFHDASAVRRVDKALQSAKRSLAAADHGWRDG